MSFLFLLVLSMIDYFEQFVIFWQHSSKLILYNSVHSLRINHFLKEPWYPLLENGILKYCFKSFKFTI